ICITPGICFSKDKYRIGYGKGYYDRFIKENHLYQIGLCYQACLLDKIPHDYYDQKVDEIITD
ncbi:MAG: 5-formyltetrahydrofolate cyclo-ligase, partial [Bacilli bacterium]